jgi:hypothetical protein
MKSILDLIKNSTTILIAVYSIITITLMCAAFIAGRDIGYTKGVVAGTTAEYVNGVNDGVRTCLETIMDRISNNQRRFNFQPQSEMEETL